MRNAIVPTSFLRRVWWADAAVSAVVGAAMAGAAGPLGELIGLPARLLAGAGLSLLPYAAFLAWLATRGGRAARRRLGAGAAQRRLGDRLHRPRRDAGRGRAAVDRLHRRPGAHGADLRRARVRRAAPVAGRRRLRRDSRGPSAIVARWPARRPKQQRRDRASIASTRCAASPSSGWRRSTSASTSTTSASSDQNFYRDPFWTCSAPASSPCSCSAPALGQAIAAARASRWPASGGAGRRSPAARCW